MYNILYTPTNEVVKSVKDPDDYFEYLDELDSQGKTDWEHYELYDEDGKLVEFTMQP